MMPYLHRLLALGLLLGAPAAAQTPDVAPARSDAAPLAPATDTSAPTVAYQGTLTDGVAPVADGTYPLTVRLLDAAGTSRYTETHTVATVGGAFALVDVDVDVAAALRGVVAQLLADRDRQQAESARQAAQIDALQAEVQATRDALAPQTARR